jgi:hypothetical protein
MAYASNPIEPEQQQQSQHSNSCCTNFDLEPLNSQQKNKLILYYMIQLDHHNGECHECLKSGVPFLYTFFNNFKSTNLKFNFKWFIRAYLFSNDREISDSFRRIICKMMSIMPDSEVNVNFDWEFFESLIGYKICPLCEMLLAVLQDINRFDELVVYLNENGYNYDDIVRAAFIRTKQEMINFVVEITERLKIGRHGSTVWNPNENEDVDIIYNNDEEVDQLHDILSKIFYITNTFQLDNQYGVPLKYFTVRSPFLCYCSTTKVEAISSHNFYSNDLGADCYETAMFTRLDPFTDTFSIGYKIPFPSSFGKTEMTSGKKYLDQVAHAQSNVQHNILTAVPLPQNMDKWARLINVRYYKYRNQKKFTVIFDMSPPYENVCIGYQMSIPSMKRLITNYVYPANYGEPGVANIIVEYVGTNHFTSDNDPCDCLNEHIPSKDFAVVAVCSICTVINVYCLYHDCVRWGNAASFKCSECIEYP